MMAGPSDMSIIQTDMDNKQKQTIAANVKELLSAISSPNRLIILCMLLDGERNVTEICEELNVRQSVVSQHMALLRHMGIVAAERRGHFMYYSIIDETTRDIISVLHKRYCAVDDDKRNAA